jgi:pyridinium-3,5-bisthiocarboxylic acid mononucleotide nickel chelatase
MTAELRGLHLHFDAPSGAAGDMTLGALFDVGVPEPVVREALARLGVPGWELQVARVMRGGIAGTDVKVKIEGDQGPAGGRHRHHHHGEHAHHHDHDHDHDRDHEHGRGDGPPHRRYAEIRDLVTRGTEGRVRDLAIAIFDKVAAAEAMLHGVPVERVEFHEVGAIDSIVDTVGTAAAVAWLAPRAISGTAPATGHGTTRCAHGVLPVPTPATVEICRAAGMPTVDGGIARELLTPTGAAILATLVERWGGAPPMTVRAVGYGAGDADLADRPNLLRAIVGETGAAVQTEDLVELEANLDDMSPEIAEHVTDRLLGAGALDVWWTHATMKKSRPAFILGVLAPVARADALAALVLTETTSLGVRFHPVRRQALDRRSERVETPWGEVAVKLGLRDGQVVNVAPEYEACRALATAKQVPLKEVYLAALTAWRRQRS